MLLLCTIFGAMKRTLLFLLALLFLFGCSRPNYKVAALEYLKTKIPNPASVDTIRFLKPDSIYTTFHDTQEYRALLKALNTFSVNEDSVKIADIKATIRQKEMTYKNKVTGWDVRLIYKAKNKKGIVVLDTCRFTFESTLSAVRDLNGVNL